MIIRLGNTLARKIKEMVLPPVASGPNPFADWTARLFTADHTQYILVSNTATLYSAVFYGRGITDANQLINRMLDNLRDIAEKDGFESIYENRVAPETGAFSFSKAVNRSVTGSMNDLIFQARDYLHSDEISCFDVALRLNKTPMSYLKYEHPRETFGRMALELERSETKDNIIPFPGTQTVRKDR
jgi:hypothetical protein